MLNWNFSNDKESGPELLKEGIYNVLVDKAELKETKAGNQAMSMTFTILDGEGRGRKLFHQFNLTGSEKAVEISRGQIKSMLKLAGKSLDIQGPQDLLGLEVAVSVKIRKDDVYGDKNVISYFKQKVKDQEPTGTPF